MAGVRVPAPYTTDPGICVGPGCPRLSAAPGGFPSAAAINVIDPRGVVVPGSCIGPGCFAPLDTLGVSGAAAFSLKLPSIEFLPIPGISVPGINAGSFPVGRGNPAPPPAAPDTKGSSSISVPNTAVAVNTSVAQVAAASEPALQHGAGPQSFDSGLTDCDIPFEQLATPQCNAEASRSGRRCEQYSRSQFTEIVQIRVYVPAERKWKTQCTGTLLSPQWVLTAAHCLIGTVSAASQAAGRGVQPGKDLIYRADELSGVMISADNVMTLTDNERDRKLTRAIVLGSYSGESEVNGVAFSDDLALFQLDVPYPAEAIEPARLASPGGFLPVSTIAGYGFSNADQGTIGRFNLTWPPLLQKTGTQFQFVPGHQSPHKSAFCQGDSGGPVLAGRTRGCRRNDKIPEYRPRYVQGVISYNMLGRSEGDSSEMRAATACMSASYMAMQDVTIKERRDWVCMRTSLEAGGC